MKKLLLSASALVLGLGLAAEASAECNGLYLAGRGGIVKHDYSEKSNLPTFDTDGLDKNKLMLSGALGYRYDYVRTELEYVWRDKSEKKTTVGDGAWSKYNFKSYSVMWNGYIDLAPYSWFTPYIGAGIGLTKLKYGASDHTAFDGTTSQTTNGNYGPRNFTWSVGGGISVKVTNRFNVDAGYRYYDMGSIRHADVTAHEIYAGLRYVF